MLDNLFTTKYIAFLDIEFQTLLKKKYQEPHILELGLIIFEKSNNTPVLIEHVNFPLLIDSNIRILTTKYSTTTEKTEILMKKLEDLFYINIYDFDSIKLKKNIIKFIPNKQIKDLLNEVIETNNYTLISSQPEEKIKKMQKTIDSVYFNLFKEQISGIHRDAFDKIMELYQKDDLVQKRNVDPKIYFEKLQNYFKNITIVHKEGMDLLALDNDLKKYNVRFTKKIMYFDIAKYNNIFKEKYGTAKLYESYIYLKNEYILRNPKLKEFDEKLYEALEKYMPTIKPHNPLSDCYFTVLVFLVMNTIK